MHLSKYFIVILPLFYLGCKDQEKSAYLEEVSEISTNLDSLETVSEKQKTDSIPIIVNTIEKTIGKVKENYVADTIYLELAALMNRYKDAKKSLSSNTGNLAKAKDAIPEVKSKLEDLRHDIENGVGDREKYEEYIRFERNKVQEIDSILSYYIQTNEKYIEQFSNAHPKVQHFADSLESKNGK